VQLDERDEARGAASDAATMAELSLLAEVGHPDAQRGLVAVSRAWDGRTDQAVAIAAFVNVRGPTPDSIAYVQSLQSAGTKGAIGATADATLGAMAGQLQSSDPARADAIAAQFEARLRAKADPSEAVLALTGLGNSSSPRILDIAPAYLASDDPSVRRMAVFALGQLEGDDARALIERAAKDDPDSRVRAQANHALARRQQG
jgi:hypothetical protein